MSTEPVDERVTLAPSLRDIGAIQRSDRMAKVAEFFLVHVGPDEAGLVNQLAFDVGRFDANIEAATQLRMGDIGIIMFLISVPTPAQQIEFIVSPTAENAICLHSADTELNRYIDDVWIRHSGPIRASFDKVADNRGLSAFVLEATDRIRSCGAGVEDMIAFADGNRFEIEARVLPSLDSESERLTDAVHSLDGQLSEIFDDAPAVSPALGLAGDYLAIVGIARVGLVHDIIEALANAGIGYTQLRESVLDGRTALVLGDLSHRQGGDTEHAVDVALQAFRTDAPASPRRLPAGQPADPRWVDHLLRHKVFRTAGASTSDTATGDRWLARLTIRASEQRGVIQQVTGILREARFNIERMRSGVGTANGRIVCYAEYDLSRPWPMSRLQVSGLLRILRELNVVSSADLYPTESPQQSSVAAPVSVLIRRATRNRQPDGTRVLEVEFDLTAADDDLRAFEVLPDTDGRARITLGIWDADEQVAVIHEHVPVVTTEAHVVQIEVPASLPDERDWVLETVVDDEVKRSDSVPPEGYMAVSSETESVAAEAEST